MATAPVAYNKPFQASTHSGLISSMEFMHEPSVAARLIGRYPEQTELGWMKEFGMLEEVKSDEFFHHEENLIFDNPFIAGVAQVGTTNAMRITLRAESHTGGGTFSYPRVGNTVEFLNGFQGLINAKNSSTANAHTIDVVPIADSSAAPISYATFSAGIAANQQFFLPSTAFAELSRGMEQSLVPSTTVFRNQLQKSSDFYEVSFEESRNQTYIPFNNPHTGENGNYIYIKGMADTETRFMLQEEMKLFIQQESGDLLKDSEGRRVKTTRGLIPQLRLHAEQMSWNNTTGITTPFFDNMMRTAKKNHSGNQFTILQGFNFAMKAKDWFVDFGAATPDIFIEGRSVNKEISLQFKRVSINNFTLDFRDLNILSHAQLTGTAGFGYTDMAIVMPMKKIKDPKTGTMNKTFTCKYKKQYGEGAAGHYKVFETGAYASSGAKDSVLSRKIHFVSDKGADVAGSKEWIFIQKTA